MLYQARYKAIVENYYKDGRSITVVRDAYFNCSDVGKVPLEASKRVELEVGNDFPGLAYTYQIEFIYAV
ncbi:MAG: hypothetical protein GWN00_32300 [Aliifodinibius sp.]|nr:hypothetical protein [Phycisphaerae bacterium]NIS50377.1 hypothetical protein [Phycisphaerae bacterium]NIT60719.1 hypothetical protein [Fodinibius sp.]NIY29301.1 hypothetical protein [Fodinibius sp.]